MSLVLEHVAAPTDDVRVLIEELDAELSGAYAPEQRHGFSIARLFQPDVLFFIARLDGEPVACGGIAFEDGLAEVKRVYVRPRARGRNIARSVLTRLVEEARGRGVTHIVLETGDAQLAAIRFYERAGFTQCAPFGAYAAMQARAIEHSVFFEKRIG